MDVPAPGNWEAFSVQILEGSDARMVKKDMEAWVNEQRNLGTLRSLDDEAVRTQAMTNGLVRYASGPVRPRKAGAGVALAAGQAPRPVPVDDLEFESRDVLVRELPRNRHGQADVGKGALTEFFGYGGKTRVVLLQYVSLDDNLGLTEEINLFSNQSRNFRLELHAIRDLAYEIAPDDSRMILVATKLDRRSFRYTIVPVSIAAHKDLVGLLGRKGRGRRLMREKRMTSEELRQKWPSAPINLAPVATMNPLP
jgi:hypothetical protein